MGKKIRLIDSLAEIAPGYDACLCDVWGVIHNGRQARPAAHEALSQFRRNGGSVILLTNAPRPHGAVREQLRGLGVPDHAYDGIITSGDVTRSLIKSFNGRPIYHLGPDRDRPIFDDLGAQLTAPDQADAIINTGLFDDTSEIPDDYRTLFESLLARQVPMICANPDLVVERGGDIVPCAGGLAKLYGEMGGAVEYAGKPYLPVYDLALRTLGEIRGEDVSRDRVLAIGDGLRTDMAGAYGAEIDALFIPSAIHVSSDANLDAVLLAKLFPDPAQQPAAAISELKW